jgi:tRNA(fMet)-specific endonuclease VapC
VADYYLDTNHASTLVTIGHSVRGRVHARLAAGDSFFLTAPVITELVFGFGLLPRAIQNMQEWVAIRPALRMLPIEESDAMDAAALQLSLRRRGWQLETVDALIATGALRNALILLTTDGDFRSVPGLVTENWFVQP